MPTPVRSLGARLPDGVIVLRTTDSTYRDGGEERVLELLREASDVSADADEAWLHARTWAERYHLTPARSNVVRPFCLPENGSVLEVGAGCGAVTRYLGETCAVVDALEPAPARAAVARERTRDLSNVEVFVGELEDLPRVETYDVVVVVGVLEYVGNGTAEPGPYLDFLAGIAARLIPGGSLVLAIENKLGAKYLAGSPEDHTNRFFDSVEGYPYGGRARTFDRTELVSLLSDAGLVASTKVAFPDYKVPRALLATDDPSPVARTLLATAPDFPSPDWGRPRAPAADEGHLWRSLVQAGLAGETGNSFVALAGKGRPSDLWPEDLVGTTFTCERRRAFRTRTDYRSADGELWQDRLTSTLPDAAPFRTRAAFHRTAAGVPLVDVFIDVDDRNSRSWLLDWVARLDEVTSSAGGPLTVTWVHDCIVSETGALVIPAAEWEFSDTGRNQLAAHNALLLGEHLASHGRPRGEWGGCATIADLVRRIGVLMRLPDSDSWLPDAIRTEAAFWASVNVPQTGPDAALDTEAVSAARHRELADLLARPLVPPADPPESLDAEIAAEIAAERERSAQRITDLEQRIAAGDAELARMKATLSWRVTRPIRAARTLYLRFRRP